MWKQVMEFAARRFYEQFSSQFSRFLVTAGASAVGSLFLKGLFGKPQTSTNSSTTDPNISPEQAPETQGETGIYPDR